MKKTILAIGAHPDDIEIGCGGTLSLLKEKGHDLIHLIITSGEEGDFHYTKKHTSEKREAEANQSAALLKASQVIFFREPDGMTTFSKETKTRLISVLREIRPDIIFTHARSDHCPDHQIVHQLTRASVLGANGPWYPDAGGIPHQATEIYGYEVWNPISDFQMAFDISTVIDRKIELIRCHQSQINDVDYVGAVTGLAKYRGIMSMTGSYAEVFEVLKVRGLQ
jgi:N-acetylglucosamine malate deacetylase 1